MVGIENRSDSSGTKQLILETREKWHKRMLITKLSSVISSSTFVTWLKNSFKIRELQFLISFH